MNQFPHGGPYPVQPGDPPRIRAQYPMPRMTAGQVAQGIQQAPPYRGPAVPPRYSSAQTSPVPVSPPRAEVSRSRELAAYALVTVGLALIGGGLVFGLSIAGVGVLTCCVAIGLVADESFRGLVGVVIAILATALTVLTENLILGSFTLLPVSAAAGGLAWSYARRRDLAPTILATVVGILVGGGLQFVLAQLQQEFAAIGVVTPVLTAWVAAALCPRKTMKFGPAPQLVSEHSRPAIVGHTARGEPVYAAAMTPVAAGPNGLAIASFICSLTALSIVAVTLGHMSVSKSRRAGQNSSGLAVAGLVLGYITMLMQIAVVGWYVAILNGAV